MVRCRFGLVEHTEVALRGIQELAHVERIPRFHELTGFILREGGNGSFQGQERFVKYLFSPEPSLTLFRNFILGQKSLVRRFRVL